jgi:hypothetical protein
MSSRRYLAIEILDELWATSPAERDSLRPYVDLAKKFRNECGCAQGGAFGTLALVLIVLYGFVYGGFTIEHAIVDIAMALAVFLCAVFTGKTMGIGIARIRLFLLGQALRRHYCVRGQ